MASLSPFLTSFFCTLIVLLIAEWIWIVEGVDAEVMSLIKSVQLRLLNDMCISGIVNWRHKTNFSSRIPLRETVIDRDRSHWEKQESQFEKLCWFPLKEFLQYKKGKQLLETLV